MLTQCTCSAEEEQQAGQLMTRLPDWTCLKITLQQELVLRQMITIGIKSKKCRQWVYDVQDYRVDNVCKSEMLN